MVSTKSLVAATANGTRTSSLSSSDSVLNLSLGDPMMFEPFWKKMSDKYNVTIGGGDLMSYFSGGNNVCWFLEPELGAAIRRLHGVVGNAVTDDRYIVVGTGSSQLLQALLYAFTTPGGPEPVSVVSSAPYYSSYAEVVSFLRSELYKWEGDAYKFNKKGAYIEVVNSPNNPDGTLREAVVMNLTGNGNGKLIYDFAYYWPQFTAITGAADYDNMLFTISKCTGHAGAYIEVVNSPNNPDGTLREAVVMNRTGNGNGKLIYDFAYYWPQFTAITGAADYDNMLFTISKCTGHAGSRIGWALVKDKDIAKKMIEYITISSIGVSKESQFRAAKIIEVVCNGIQNVGSVKSENFFKYARNILSKRWQKLRETIQNSEHLILSKYPQQHCLFSGKLTETLSAYAWLESKDDTQDCNEFLRGLKIIGKSGKICGAHQKFARINLMCREEEFSQFIERLSATRGKGIINDCPRPRRPRPREPRARGAALPRPPLTTGEEATPNLFAAFCLARSERTSGEFISPTSSVTAARDSSSALAGEARGLATGSVLSPVVSISSLSASTASSFEACANSTTLRVSSGACRVPRFSTGTENCPSELSCGGSKPLDFFSKGAATSEPVSPWMTDSSCKSEADADAIRLRTNG
ncbi:l-tryptophan--pyruvate aminotransferase 1 [Quercus suber]|uniref:L-tryptophan--pyruvate aminotransferase 1 n=1 Tax=Quercus suber TaxID=58331 RepID=A0AAW0KS01_QUESU